MTSTSGNAVEDHDKKSEVQALSDEQKLQILSSVLARVDADCQIILAKASQKKRVTFGDFKVIWADTEFDRLFVDVPSCVKLSDLIEEVFYTVTLYWQKPFMNYKKRAAVIFLLYILVNIHPLGEDAFSIRFTPSDLNYWRDVEKEARSRQHHDLLYCMGSLLIRGQIRVTCTNRPYELLSRHSLRLEHHETPAPEPPLETASASGGIDNQQQQQPLQFDDALKETTQNTFCTMFKLDEVLKKYGEKKKEILNTKYVKENPGMEKLLEYVDGDFAVNFCNSMKTSKVDIIKKEIDVTAERRRQKKKRRDERMLADKAAMKGSIASVHVGHTTHSQTNVDDNQSGVEQITKIRKLWYERLRRPMSPTPPSSEHDSDESLEPHQESIMKYARRHHRITNKLKSLLQKKGVDASSSEEDLDEESKPHAEIEPVPKSARKSVKKAPKKTGELGEEACSSLPSLDPLEPLEPQPGPSGMRLKSETSRAESDRDNDNSILGI